MNMRNPEIRGAGVRPPPLFLGTFHELRKSC
jgi:hypothetical protein